MTLGISGLSALASLTPYRPYFLGVSFLALGYSYFTTYRRRGRDSKTSAERRYRPAFHEVVLWGVTVLVLLLVLFPYYGPWLLSS